MFSVNKVVCQGTVTMFTPWCVVLVYAYLQRQRTVAPLVKAHPDEGLLINDHSDERLLINDHPDPASAGAVLSLPVSHADLLRQVPVQQPPLAVAPHDSGGECGSLCCQPGRSLTCIA